MMMAENTERRSLEYVSVFANLDKDSLSRLNAHCRWRGHEPGSDVVDLGDSATDVHFLTDGLARVVIHTSRGKDIAFRTIEAGDVFGEFAAIDGGPRSASVEVLKPSMIGSMNAREFREALVNEPELCMALLMQLTGEVRRLTARVLEFSTLAVANRIQSELLRLAGGDVDPSGEVLIRPAPKHALIASRVSTHREAVTKELGRLTRLGVIERRGSDLAVTDTRRLARMVRDASDE